MLDGILQSVALIARELALFAACGFAIGGLSDLIVDFIWLGRTAIRRLTVYRRHERATADTLPPPAKPGRIAIFVAAWDESAVIGHMLRHAVQTLNGGDWVLYVGTYPNDPATIAAVRAVGHSRIRLVVGEAAGPTTKADCLNTLWRALLADEGDMGARAKAVVLHDAEDVMHSCEVALFDRLIERFALVQLPVLPLVDGGSRWVGGHYLDEFSESHGKTIIVREAIGAAIPSAGVGCAFDRDMLGRIAVQRAGAPFDADSLTEDYELGLRVAQMGGRGAFVRIPASAGGAIVAVRAHFPATLEAAVRQKARWITGIALSGWDRLGWRASFAENWMRLHDRRALMTALVLVAAHVALVLGFGVSVVATITGKPLPLSGPVLSALLLVCTALMLWRLAMRAGFVTANYGWREGMRSIPRAFVANIVAMIAAHRALSIYRRGRRDGVVRWDKTAHRFPASVPAE